MKYFLLLAISAAGLAGCDADQPPTATAHRSPAENSPLPVVELQLNWFPEAEHGGYFAAEVHGYFEEAGLDVVINAGGPGTQVVQAVATGRATFGVTNADRVLLGRSQGADTVAVMAPMQDSPRCIMVHENSRIRDFAGLKNITLAMSSTSTFALFLQKRLPLTDVRIVPYSGNVAQFLANENFAQQAYIFSEPFVAKKQGGDPYNLMVSDLGFNPYTSVLITGDEQVTQHPELVRKMVMACVRGWQKYLEDPAETNRYIQGLNPEMDADILQFGATALKPLCITETTDREHFGQMAPERWNELASQLVEAGVIKAGSVDPSAAFTTTYLPVAQP